LDTIGNSDELKKVSSTSLATAAPLLSVRNLRTYLKLGDQILKLVEDVSFDLGSGEILGLVGESGAGKTVLCRSLLGLVNNTFHPVMENGPQSEVLFENKNLLSLSESQLNEIRGKRVALIPQDPMSSLHPALSVKTQLTETLRRHQTITKEAAVKRSIEMLEKVGIEDPSHKINFYPHQFSGGMRQRVLIAMALLCEPSLLIADEPTTALDTLTQAKVIELIQSLSRELNLSLIWISHDLGLLASIVDRIAVMYAGRIVEMGSSEALLKTPRHPYTQALLKCAPSLTPEGESHLPTIPGITQDATNRPGGCDFRPRCAVAESICAEDYPPIRQHGKNHWSACILDEDQV